MQDDSRIEIDPFTYQLELFKDVQRAKAAMTHPSMSFHVRNADVPASELIIESTMDTLFTAARRAEIEAVIDVPEGPLTEAEAQRYFP